MGCFLVEKLTKEGTIITLDSIWKFGKTNPKPKEHQGNLVLFSVTLDFGLTTHYLRCSAATDFYSKISPSVPRINLAHARKI